MLKRSFDPVPIISSLNNGLPIRCTWRQSPSVSAGSGDRRTVTRGREVVAQTPIVAAGEVAGSMRPVRVSISMGTSMAMAFTA